MLVKDVMTAPVISVDPSLAIGDAARLMLAHGFSGLPVVTADGRLAGIVSEGDFLRRTELGTERRRPRWLEFLEPGKIAGEYARAHGRKVGEVMTGEVATTRPDASLDEIVDIMSSRHIKRLPVVDGGALVGIISRSDLLRALAGRLASGEAAATTDEQIRQAILAEFAKQSWTGTDLIRVTVKGGAVELGGSVFDDRQRTAARIVAENVPGVKSVVDRQIWIEPYSGTLLDEGEETATPVS